MKTRYVAAGTWVLAGICWCSLWTTAQAGEKVSPKVWLQQYLGVEFPDSARHFVLYCRSAEQDVVLFSFDIAQGDLPALINDGNVFPGYGDLGERSTGLPEQIAHDAGYRSFAEKVAALRNGLSAIRRRDPPAEPREIRVWMGEAPAGTREVCVSVIADRQMDKLIVPGTPETPAAPLESRSCVIIDSGFRQGYDTSVWQRWSLSESGCRQFVETMKARRDVIRLEAARVRKLVDTIEAQGRLAAAPEWKPSELVHSLTGSEPVEGFRFKGSENMSSVLVAGRAGGVFQCYAWTQRPVLVPDPRDTITRMLGTTLPTGAREEHCESASSPAGIAFWIRFDLPQADWMTYRANSVTLSRHAKFRADAALKEYLETEYHTGAPPWWQPEQLQEGRYAQRRTNGKDLSEVTVGFGRLSAENVRVYIGAFSPW